MLLKGLSAFPITPSDAEGRVDVAAVRKLASRLSAAEVDSIGLLGSTGTYAYLTRSERRRALEAALDEVGGQVPVLVGVGALRTDEAVRLAQDAKAAGAAAGLLAPVSYTPLTENEIFEHFATVARESGLSLCIYDNPSTTHFRFSPALIGRLSRLPEIIAVKSPAPEPQAIPGHLAELRSVVPDGSRSDTASTGIGSPAATLGTVCLLASFPGSAWPSSRRFRTATLPRRGG
jgi:4-hydroxy-tetrahydrodipicolinate synthase